jgi:hypothetical protein
VSLRRKLFTDVEIVDAAFFRVAPVLLVLFRLTSLLSLNRFCRLPIVSFVVLKIGILGTISGVLAPYSKGNSVG